MVSGLVKYWQGVQFIDPYSFTVDRYNYIVVLLLVL